VPLDVLSTELSIAFSPPNQYFLNITSTGVNFCGKKIAVIVFYENVFFLQIAKRTAKIAKIRTHKKLA